MKKHSSHSIAVIEKRRQEIVKIKENYKDKGIKLTIPLLLEELSQQGHKVSRGTVERDLVEIAGSNNYVRDIAENTYSEVIEDMMEGLKIIESKYWQWLDKPPQVFRDKVEPDNDGKMKVVESTIETVSPITIADNIVEVIGARKALLSGDVLNISIALLGEKYRLLEAAKADAEKKFLSLQSKKNVSIKLKELPDASSK